MKEENLARSTLLNCRRIYSPIGKDISSDFLQLKQKNWPRSIHNTATETGFHCLVPFMWGNDSLSPKGLCSHQYSSRVMAPWDESRATQDRDEDTNPFLKGNTGWKWQASACSGVTLSMGTKSPTCHWWENEM